MAVCNSLNLGVLVWQGPSAPEHLVTSLSTASLAPLCHSSTQNREWDHRHTGLAECEPICTKWFFFFLDNKGDGIWAQDILGTEQINALKFVYPNNKHRYLSVFPSLWFSPGVMFKWGNLSKAAFCHEPKRRGEEKFLAKKWNQTEQFWNFFICVLWDMCLMSWWFLCCRNLGCAS